MISALCTWLALLPRLISAAEHPIAKYGSPMHADRQLVQDTIALGSANVSRLDRNLNARSLFQRQTGECEDPGYVPCINIPEQCCPPGYDCFSDGCCEHGSLPCANYPDSCCPAGDDCFSDSCCAHGYVPCGDIETGICIDPDTETCCGTTGTYHPCKVDQKCCGDEGCYNPDDPEIAVCCEENGGTCEEGYKCCGTVCCYPWEYCDSLISGQCEPDPDATCTTTVTVPSTILDTETKQYTVYTTTTEEPPELHPIKCPKTSFVNSLSTTVKIDDQCLITVLPPRMTPKPVKRTAALERKQASSCYFTKTVTVVSGTTSTTIVYETVTSPTTITNPLCYPLTASNCWGDKLKLDSKCSFAFAKGTETCSSSIPGPTASATGAGPVGDGRSQTGSNAAASQTSTGSRASAGYLIFSAVLSAILAFF